MPKVSNTSTRRSYCRKRVARRRRASCSVARLTERHFPSCSHGTSARPPPESILLLAEPPSRYKHLCPSRRHSGGSDPWSGGGNLPAAPEGGRWPPEGRCGRLDIAGEYRAVCSRSMCLGVHTIPSQSRSVGPGWSGHVTRIQAILGTCSDYGKFY